MAALNQPSNATSTNLSTPPKDEVVGQIGNLMLVDDKTNEKLSTNDFAQKKKILSAAGYQIPEILKRAKTLDARAIRRNTKRISELSRDVIWKV